MGFLCLSRRPNESVTIDTTAGPIVINVNRIESDRVRLAIHAPIEYKILRTELLTEKNDDMPDL